MGLLDNCSQHLDTPLRRGDCAVRVLWLVKGCDGGVDEVRADDSVFTRSSGTIAALHV